MSLVVATSAAHAVEYVGLPEAQLNLAQAVVHLATAPKSNAATVAIGKALEDVDPSAGTITVIPSPLLMGLLEFQGGGGVNVTTDPSANYRPAEPYVNPGARPTGTPPRGYRGGN